MAAAQPQLQLQLQQQPQQPGANGGAAATSIEPVQVPARFGPSSASRIGTLFWPQMTAAAQPAPAASRKRSRGDAALTDEDRKLEEDLGLQRVAKPKPAPGVAAAAAAAASPKQEPDGSSSKSISVAFTDSLPGTRASASRPVGAWWAATSHAGASELRDRGKLPDADPGSPPVVAPTEEGVLRGLVTEELTSAMLRPATAAVLMRTGFDRAQASALETLAEVRCLPPPPGLSGGPVDWVCCLTVCLSCHRRSSRRHISSSSVSPCDAALMPAHRQPSTPLLSVGNPRVSRRRTPHRWRNLSGWDRQDRRTFSISYKTP